MSSNYNIELSEQQAIVLISATEMYARLLAGQTFTLSDHLIAEISTEDLSQIRDLLRQVEKIIYNNKLPKPKQSNIAWDMYQSIRYRISWDKYPEGGNGVCFDRPICMSGEPLIKIKKL